MATAIGVAEQTLASWRSDRQGPNYVKLGKTVFYRRADLEQWIAANVHDAKLGGVGVAGNVVPLHDALA
mgnify:FL=1